MTQEENRKLIIKALYQDYWLYNQLVLKGGNALSIIYNVGNRATLDLDFSIERDFDNIEQVSRSMLTALSNTFSEVGIIVFDFILEPKPQHTNYSWWGGYRADFKLIPKSIAEDLDFNIDDMRRRSLPIDPGSQRRKYSIEISKYEYIGDKSVRNLDGVDVYVYSPLLLAIEKLRALVQQHPSYPYIPNHMKRSRARDLYDIWAISDYFSIKLDEYFPTVEAVFKAKNVDLNMLNSLPDVKELHKASWTDVELSVSRSLYDFDYYFNYVNSIAQNLYAQWVEYSP